MVEQNTCTAVHIRILQLSCAQNILTFEKCISLILVLWAWIARSVHGVPYMDSQICAWCAVHGACTVILLNV